MPRARLLVVEDQSIIALDLRHRLTSLGYAVVAAVADAQAAIEQAGAARPDLVLMDIRLKGEMDGIQAAERIRADFDLPIIYLTAHSDEPTLQRAKLTEPYGYVLKPFEDRELHMAIEIALYKHRMEAQLKEHQRWLAATLTSIGDAVIATDREGRVKFMNPAAEAATGWARTDAIGQALNCVFKIVDEETRAPVMDPVASVLQNGAVVGLANHTTLIARDGRERPIEDSAAPIRDERDRLTGVVLVFHDVTERRLAEKKVQDSERRFRALIEKSSDGITVAGADGTITYSSPSVARILGYSPDERRGQPMLELLHPDDRSGCLAQLARLTQTPGSSVTIQGRFRHRDGRWRWLEVTATNLLDDAAVGGLVANFHDITARRQADEQLRLLSRAVEQSPASIVITDTAGRIEYVNPRFTEVTGYTAAEALGRNPRLLKSGETPAAEYERLWAALVSGGEWRGEFSNRKKNGELFWELASISAIRNEAGEITQYLAVKEDITERRQVAEALRASNTELARLLAQAKALTAAAQQASRLKDEILANTSHELRTPLTAIMGALDIVLGGFCASEEEMRALVRAARDASDKLLDLVTNLLDLARLEAGKIPLKRDKVDLALLLAEVQALMRGQAEAKRLTLTIQYPAELLPACIADREHLRRILLNLVGNALKFTEQGRVEVGARVVDTETGPQVWITVQDTGIGILPEKQGQLFQPFVQADGGTTRRFGGTGLGLSISRRLAELMGGALSLYSAGDSQGSTFTLALPAWTEERTPEP